ncbi:Transcription factor like [Quillaja saponaria]|uniref:Transcription factor like n=1 Tax=Quillaja saponaria TaxID=32244 RepID=A0AAD7PWS9_QUISA|nr:Transcription factor like [Quillaja saponaria]
MLEGELRQKLRKKLDKREIEREAARQALLQMEKTVDVNENSVFLEDLEMLRAAPAEQLPSSVDETSPEHSQDGLGIFEFWGSNPLEQLGLYMKVDEEVEEGDPSCVPNPVNDVEEGEID